MDQNDLLKFVADAMERKQFRYGVTGSQASSLYGENRFTQDIDVVIDLRPSQLPELLSEFPNRDFYVSEDGARHAAEHGGQFNVIHQDSSQKIDFIVPRNPAWPDQFSTRSNDDRVQLSCVVRVAGESNTEKDGLFSGRGFGQTSPRYREHAEDKW